MLLDLAVPRDVEPDASALPGVTLFDVGALRDRGSAEEDEAVERARGIVAEEVRRFVVRRRGGEVSPVFRAHRRRGDAGLVCAVPFDNRGPVQTNTEYYAFKVNLLRSRTAGNGACAGCSACSM